MGGLQGAQRLLWPFEDNPKILVNESTVYRGFKCNIVAPASMTSKGLQHGFGV